MNGETKIILDACCGSRMCWFDKENPLALFADIRDEEYILCDGRNLKVHPDIVSDFTDMPFLDKSFKLVVFDPPHLLKVGKDSWLAKKYGKLPEDWPRLIKKGVDECFRVLEDYGVLIFKWNEDQITVKEVLKAIERQPLFGHNTKSKVPALKWELQTKPPTSRGKFWTPERIAKLASPFHKHPDGTPMTGEEVFDRLWGKDVPAWSLSRLLEILPPLIPQQDNHPDLDLEISVDNVFWFIRYIELGYDCKHEVMKENIFDAVINMIDWLIANGHFNKEYYNEKDNVQR